MANKIGDYFRSGKPEDVYSSESVLQYFADKFGINPDLLNENMFTTEGIKDLEVFANPNTYLPKLREKYGTNKLDYILAHATGDKTSVDTLLIQDELNKKKIFEESQNLAWASDRALFDRFKQWSKNIAGLVGKKKDDSYLDPENIPEFVDFTTDSMMPIDPSEQIDTIMENIITPTSPDEENEYTNIWSQGGAHWYTPIVNWLTGNTGFNQGSTYQAPQYNTGGQYNTYG